MTQLGPRGVPELRPIAKHYFPVAVPFYVAVVNRVNTDRNPGLRPLRRDTTCETSYLSAG